MGRVAVSGQAGGESDGREPGPRNEFAKFPAALSFIFGLFPDEARAVLERRAIAVRDNQAALERVLAGGSGPLPPRVTLLETEYLRAVTAAELNWLTGVIANLESGELSWSHEQLAEAAAASLAN